MAKSKVNFLSETVPPPRWMKDPKEIEQHEWHTLYLDGLVMGTAYLLYLDPHALVEVPRISQEKIPVHQLLTMLPEKGIPPCIRIEMLVWVRVWQEMGRLYLEGLEQGLDWNNHDYNGRTFRCRWPKWHPGPGILYTE